MEDLMMPVVSWRVGSVLKALVAPAKATGSVSSAHTEAHDC